MLKDSSLSKGYKYIRSKLPPAGNSDENNSEIIFLPISLEKSNHVTDGVTLPMYPWLAPDFTSRHVLDMPPTSRNFPPEGQRNMPCSCTSQMGVTGR